MSLVLGVLIASLLGSVHCAGMCGGFVCFYAAGKGSGTLSHLAYNAGRLVSYLILGSVAGVAGIALDRVGSLAGLSRGAAILSGTLMVAWGASTLLATRGVRLFPISGTRARNPLGAVIARLRDRSATVRAGAIGLLTTLLPCGWLYAFVATAAGTGSVERALLTMGVFWLGTLPMMLAAGYAVQRLSGPLRARLPMVTATAVVVMGLLSIAGKLRVDPHVTAPVVNAVPTMSHDIH